MVQTDNNQPLQASCSALRGKCKAWCCKCIFVDYTHKDVPDDLYFALRKIKIVKMTPSYWTLAIPNRCRWLRSDNRCKDYMHRPKSCRVWRCEALKEIDEMYQHGETQTHDRQAA